MTTSDRVVDLLVSEGGYRELPKPFKVGAISFDFTHVLVAGERANDLVVVIEVKGDAQDDAVIRRMLAFTRALDVMRSKRPVTAVLTSGQVSAETVRSMSNVCRVLPLGAPSGPTALTAVRDWLSVLLPLQQPSTKELQVSWEHDFRALLPQDVTADLVEAVVGAAALGKEAVEAQFSSAMENAIAPALQEEGDN
ncbi:hypothetical protein [Pseudorhodoferax sp. Leaf267]|uniref:hypothetical protein n=1 Tax=Pseudorhodoferax sp. Leaf267 TaxID=1736316 RepID=UPI0006F4096C|nr:hypothetical protein [Pseudorhodoferax sp. Leaf267]KQP23353.1 hypothetical protein ASF43_05690 [Pseudorhodoferax sp. Leaf267]